MYKRQEVSSGTVESWKEDTTLSSNLYDEVISDDVLGETEPPKTLIDDSVVDVYKRQGIYSKNK